MAPHFDFLTFGTDTAPYDLPIEYREEKPRLSQVLNEAWKTLDVLRMAGEHARSQFTIDRQSQVSRDDLRSLVFHLATAHRSVIGQLPAATKGTWFATVATVVANEICGCSTKLGDRLVLSVLSDLRAREDAMNKR